MALEYHLLTCLGTGTTVTLTIASPCVVTLTNHGMRNGHPVVFSGSGNTLPTGLTKGTTYYVRSTAANTFNLYATEAQAKDTGSTTGRINTSGSQSGTHILVGDYWYRLPVTDPGGGGNYRDRYYFGGAYRCFGTWNAWHTGRTARMNFKTELILEIQGKWTETRTAYIAGNSIEGFFSVKITTKINGVFGDAYHGGMVGAGFVLQASGNTRIAGAVNNMVIEGLGIDASAYDSDPIAIGAKPTIDRCIIRLHPNQRFMINIGSVSTITNNIIIGGSIGIYIANYATSSGSVIAYNLVVGATKGFSANTSASGVFVLGNVAIGCTTNWDTAIVPTGSYLGYNAGISGDTPWNNSGEPVITNLSTAHFIDYANQDYRYTSDSPLIDAGHQVFVVLDPVAITNALSVNGDPRPSYKGGLSTNWDIGPFEYDHGNGLAPQQVTLAFSGMAEGSILAVYKTSDGTAIISPTTIGASGSHSTTYSYTGNVQITVVVRKGTSGTKYLPYSAPGLITSTGFSLIVNQVADGVLNG